MSEKLDKISDKKAKLDALDGRDVIYVDTDDDITSIIEKIKKSGNSIVALVPPARIGVLQSVVNLKLLQRATKSSRKKLSLITSDDALIALAAGLKIPVAKNISEQSVIPAAKIEELPDDDVIDGNDLTIGELDSLSGESTNSRNKKEDKDVSAAVAAIETDDKIRNDKNADGIPDDQQESLKKKSARNKKIPNFSSFRKKVLIFGSIGIFLTGFFVWAIIFAPHGTITIAAQTEEKSVNETIKLSSLATDVETNNINAIVKQKKVNESVNFNATGTKEVGEKAKGTITIYVKEADITSAGITIPAGTQTRSNNKDLPFVTNKTVSLPGSIATGQISLAEYKKYCQDGTCAILVGLTAVNLGAEYNIPDGALMTVSGGYSAIAKGGFTGGSKQTVTVVQQSDINLATERLKDQLSPDEKKSELTSQMDKDVIIIQDSFSVDYGKFTSNPAIDESSSPGANPSLSVEVTYTLIGVKKNDLGSLLDAKLKSKTDENSNQKIYDNGLKSVEFKNFRTIDDGHDVAISAVGAVGPKIDEKQIKQESVKKQSGEIRETLNKISGVNDVKVEFSPFWVNSVSSANKLKINFVVDEQK